MKSRHNSNSRLSQEKWSQDSIARAVVPEIQPEQAAGFIVEHIATSEYKAQIDETVDSTHDLIYDDNSKFWKAIFDSKVHANTIVNLTNFTLTDWVPRSPGTFHTRKASYARNEAWNHCIPEELYSTVDDFLPITNAACFDWEGRGGNKLKRIDNFFLGKPVIFAPRGKLSMIQGGIGCVRLQPLELRHELFWLLGASSSNIAHEGIPVAIHDDHYNEFAEDVIKGGLTCDLTGRIRYIRPPDQLEYGRGVPRCYLEVEKIIPRRLNFNIFPKRTSTLVCVAVSFEDESGDLLATYASFESNSRESFSRALEWMSNEYVSRLYHGKILTDFDERTAPFSDVMFRLKDIMAGNILSDSSGLTVSIKDKYCADRVAQAVEKVSSITIKGIARMTTNKIITIGENTTINSPITIADQINNSFNAVQNMPGQEELKTLLENLLKSIVDISPEIPVKISKDLTRDANDVIQEATSDEPRNEVCQTLLGRVASAATTLGTVAIPLNTCVSELSKFFSSVFGQ